MQLALKNPPFAHPSHDATFGPKPVCLEKPLRRESWDLECPRKDVRCGRNGRCSRANVVRPMSQTNSLIHCMGASDHVPLSSLVYTIYIYIGQLLLQLESDPFGVVTRHPPF